MRGGGGGGGGGVDFESRVELTGNGMRPKCWVRSTW